MVRGDDGMLKLEDLQVDTHVAAIQHFAVHYGTQVAITVDVAAKCRTGFDAKTVRAVRENSARLKCKAADFEVK